MISNADITIYKKVPGKDRNTWTRSHVKDVNWQETRKMAVGNNGFVTADVIAVFIPFTAAPCLVPHKGDIIARGLLDFEIDETDPNSNVKALKKMHSGAMTVLSASKRDLGGPDMQHWEVTLG